MKNKSKQALISQENYPSKQLPSKKLGEKQVRLQPNRAFGVDLTQLHTNSTSQVVLKVPLPVVTQPPQLPEMEYYWDIVRYLSSTQGRFSIFTNNIRSRIALKSRTTIVSFMQDICAHFAERKETLFTAVYLFDRYISEVALKESSLVIYAFACLHIAMKYEEIYPPRLGEYALDVEPKEIILAESCILKYLNFDLTYEGPFRYLEMWGDLLELSKEDCEAVELLLTMCLSDEHWGRQPASVLAAASIGLYSKLAKLDIKLTKLFEHIDQAAYQLCLREMTTTINDNPETFKNTCMRSTSEKWMRLFS